MCESCLHFKRGACLLEYDITEITCGDKFANIFHLSNIFQPPSPSHLFDVNNSNKIHTSTSKEWPPYIMYFRYSNEGL